MPKENMVKLPKAPKPQLLWDLDIDHYGVDDDGKLDTPSKEELRAVFAIKTDDENCNRSHNNIEDACFLDEPSVCISVIANCGNELWLGREGIKRLIGMLNEAISFIQSYEAKADQAREASRKYWVAKRKKEKP